MSEEAGVVSGSDGSVSEDDRVLSETMRLDSEGMCFLSDMSSIYSEAIAYAKISK